MQSSQGLDQTLPSVTRRRLLRAATLAGLAVSGGIGHYMAQVTDVSAASDLEALSSGPLADQLAWLLGAVNSGANALTEAEVAEHVAPGLLAVIPAAQIIGFVQALAAGYGTFTLEGTTRPQTATQAVALISAEIGLQLALPIAIEAGAPHRITGLTVYSSPSGDGTAILPDREELSGSTAAPLVDIGGRGLYRAEAGNGGPTVVFEAGLGDSAAAWSGIIPAVASFTLVVSYDRANTNAGASDPAPMPRTAANAVADLHALLTASGAPAPYVLVGHSVGGIFTRLYASKYPDDVSGMVLVDASHEEQDARRQAMVSTELFAAEQQAVSANAEGIDLAVSFTEMREARAAKPLKPMPLAVLSAGLEEPTMFPAGWPMEAEAQLHAELQSDLAGLVPDRRRVIGEKSGHYIQQSQPDLVVAAIRDVVQAVIDPKSWDVDLTSTQGPPL